MFVVERLLLILHAFKLSFFYTSISFVVSSKMGIAVPHQNWRVILVCRRLFFIIEFVNGGDLMFHMQRQRRLPEEHARFYSAEICLALNFLHEKGFILMLIILTEVIQSSCTLWEGQLVISRVVLKQCLLLSERFTVNCINLLWSCCID